MGPAVDVVSGDLRATINSLLRRHGCPPKTDYYATATGLVLPQPEVIAEGVA
ncbi:hypothetical protein GCM10009641_47130 [Mycobacterium cookii]|uniref:Uncharacterized protein n=1 Tax=Nocardioides furvisabuli TaxID=375542 RepID=A0ABN2XP00_9ACTN|nr:hypothetical protein [Nocardioides furvisabuli]